MLFVVPLGLPATWQRWAMMTLMLESMGLSPSTFLMPVQVCLDMIVKASSSAFLIWAMLSCP